MTYFICQSEFSVSKETLFSFHASPEGFQTLVGLAKGIEVIDKPSSLRIGETAVMRVPIFPFIKVKWVAKHIAYEKNRLFADTQITGPFIKFEHYHKFQSIDERKSILTDQIEVKFLFWAISKWFVLQMLKKQFLERHKATANFLNCDSKLVFCGYSVSIID
jgi:ligand-binding SRPBCC domain-containing protein